MFPAVPVEPQTSLQMEEGLLTQGFPLSFKLGTLPQSPRASLQIKLGHS